MTDKKTPEKISDEDLDKVTGGAKLAAGALNLQLKKGNVLKPTTLNMEQETPDS